MLVGRRGARRHPRAAPARESAPRSSASSACRRRRRGDDPPGAGPFAWLPGLVAGGISPWSLVRTADATTPPRRRLRPDARGAPPVPALDGRGRRDRARRARVGNVAAAPPGRSRRCARRCGCPRRPRPAPAVPAAAELGIPGLASGRHPERRLLPHRHRARSCRGSTRPTGRCASTAWSTARCGSPGTSCSRCPMTESYVTLACVSNEVGGDPDRQRPLARASRSASCSPARACTPDADMVLSTGRPTGSPRRPRSRR